MSAYSTNVTDSNNNMNGGAGVVPAAAANLNLVQLVNDLNSVVDTPEFKNNLPTTLVFDNILSTLNLQNGDFANLIQGVVNNSRNKKDYIVHNNVQILNVPLANEVLKRVVSPMYAAHINIPITDDLKTMLSDLYKTIPGGLEDAYIASLNVSADVAAKWDARVKKIRDSLATKKPDAGQTVFSEKNKIEKPNMLSVTRLSSADPVLKEAVVRSLDISSQRVNPIGAWFNISANPRRQAGGSVRNLHAPLYPKLVMNGGANPFAVLSGGASNPVDMQINVIENNIKQLKEQYKSVSGQELNNAIDTSITNYVGKVREGLNGLQKDLSNLREVTGYLAQNPLGEGLSLPASPDELASLAEKSRAVTEKSLRLSNQFKKLSDIERELKTVVDQLTPRK